MKIEKIMLNNENLKEIKRIDDICFSDSVYDLKWYLDRYNSNYYGYGIYDEGKMIGYIISAPIKKDFYNALIKGVLIDDTCVNPEMFINKSKYNYVACMAMMPEYQKKGIGIKLVKSVIKEVPSGRYVALTVSDAGCSIASKYMKLKKKVNDKIKVFELKI